MNLDQALPNGIPAHIPAHLVFDFDRFRAPETRRCPHRQVHDLYRTAPRIFYTPRNGGHWIIGRAEDALDMLRRIDLFSSDPKYCPAMMREPRTNPNRYDPPEHTEFRAIINPFFSPRAVQARETEIRDLARALIAEVRVRGQCEFFEEIGRRYPVNIFLKMANAPPSDRAVLLEYVDGFTKKPDLAERNASLAALGEHLKHYVAEREAKPGDEKKDDKPIGPEFETIPAGPVFVSVDHSDGAAAINSLMQKRAFQIADYTFTGLPQKSDELFEPAPPVAAPTAPDKPAAPPK